ncbi:MAG: hypothetical protein ACRDQA_08095, partial [Nocardioidaceae bacterium]
SDTGRPPAKSAAGGSDAKPDFSLLPTGDLLAKLHALIPVGEAVPSVGPSTTEHHARQDDQRRVELRTAGSARAISGDQQTSDVQLAAVLAALLGLTLAAGALARAWVVRRSR